MCCSTRITRHLAATAASGGSAISSITPTQTPSVGSSSIRSCGRPSTARPIASILRSPPDSVPAVWPSRCAELGEEIEHIVHARAVGLADAAQQQVLAHRELGEDRVLLRHVADAAPHALLGRARASTAAPSSRIVPDIGGSSPNNVFSSVDLPAPLRPRTATAPRAGDLQRHVEQRLAAAVAGAEAGDLEEGGSDTAGDTPAGPWASAGSSRRRRGPAPGPGRAR